MKKSNIMFIVLAVAVAIIVYLAVGKADTVIAPAPLMNSGESRDIETDSNTRATDYNSSRSNRTTGSVMNDMDQDCTGPDCTVLDDDSDDDSVPPSDASAEAGYDAHIKIGEIKGEAREN